VNEEIAAGFSNPFEAFDEDFRIRWATARAATRIRAFLERWAPVLDQCSAEIASVLRAFADRLLDDDDGNLFEAIWHPFSNLDPIDEIDTSSPAAAVSRATQFMLRLCECNHDLRVSVRLPKKARLTFAHYQLDEASALSLTAASTKSTIELVTSAGVTKVVFERYGAGWRLASGSTPRHPTVTFAGSTILVCPMSRSIEAPDGKVIPADDAMVEALSEALRLIELSSAAYTRWIGRMLRVVVPLRPVPGQFDSETFASLNGTVFVSLHPDVIRIAETLVHEVSHDYLHLLNGVDMLADATGAETCFSPVRRCQRPTLGVLKAQHAFTNALIFYYLLELHGVPLEGEYARGIKRLEAWRSDMERSLGHAPSVTPLGERLWRPLSRRADQFQVLHRATARANLSGGTYA
jgi:HEXXH motif-containing protein